MINAVPNLFFRAVGLSLCKAGRHDWHYLLEGAPEEPLGGMAVIYGRKTCRRCGLSMGYVTASMAPIYDHGLFAKQRLRGDP